MQIDSKDLIPILTELLSMRAKAFESPCSSGQHWCTAMEKFAELLPGYQPTDPEHLYDFKASLLNQAVLHGQMSNEEANKQLEKYQPHPHSLSASLDGAGLLD